MNAKDVKCPICGTVNRSLDLDEADGWNVNTAITPFRYWRTLKPSAFRYTQVVGLKNKKNQSCFLGIRVQGHLQHQGCARGY